MNPQHAVAEELATHGKALRCLARDLVGTVDAGDVVQEAALRALRSPPPEPGGLGAWLATIVRNLAGNHRRSAHRRRRRELDVATRAEPVPDPAEVAARREVLRAVTAALWRLKEPYQTALVLRYFEERTPTEIAERTAVPLATVKSRLQRGLQMLREALDQGDGQRWRGTLLLATGLRSPVPITSSVATANLLLMTQTTKMVLVAAVLAVAACFVFDWNRIAAPGATPAHAATGALASAAAGGGQEGRGSELRELAGGAVAPPVDLEHRFEYRLRCRAVDRDGLPAAGVQFVIAPRLGALNLWPLGTVEGGVGEFGWRAKVQTLSMTVGAMRGASQVLREVELQAGAVREVLFLIEDGGGGGFCAAAQMMQGQQCRSCHVGTVHPQLFDAQLWAHVGRHPATRLADLLLARVPASVDMHEPAPSEGPDLVLRESSEGAIGAKVESAAERGSVRGMVFDGRGLPIGDTTVIWGTVPDRPMGRATTRADGAFAFEGVPAGDIEVRAGGGSPGLGRANVQVAAGQTRQCVVQLHRGNVLGGRIDAPADASVEGWRVEYAAEDGSHLDGTTARADGTFAMANLPPGSGTLLLWSSGGFRFPAAIVRAVQVGDTQVRIDLRMNGLPAGVLRVRPSLPAELAGANVEVMVWQRDSGRAAMAALDAEGAYQVLGLPAGFYRMAIGAGGSGWIAAGEHWVDGRGVTDLGAVVLPMPGRLRFVNAPDDFELCQRRPDLDLRAESLLMGTEQVLLPTGTWLALWGGHEAPQVREFVVTVDGETVFDFAAAGQGPAGKAVPTAR